MIVKPQSISFPPLRFEMVRVVFIGMISRPRSSLLTPNRSLRRFPVSEPFFFAPLRISDGDALFSF